MSSALLKETEIDLQAARYVNDNLSEYLIPVSADVRQVEVMMVPEADGAVNPMGIKGIGEIGIVGVNAASPMPCTMRRAAAFAACRSA